MESNHGIIDSTITLRPGRYSVSGAAPGRRWCWACLSPPLAWGAEEQMPLYSSSAHPRAGLQPPSHLQSPKHRCLKATAGAQGRGSGATALCPQALPAHDSLCMAEHPEHDPAAPGCPTSQPQSLLFSRSSPHQQARTGGWYMNTDVEELHRQIYTAFVQRKKMNQITK